MNSLQLSILSTLALYSAEGRSALTLDEIHRYLHKRPTTGDRRPETGDEIMKQLAELKTNGLVFSDGDYYSLENRAGLVVENIKKARQSADKIKKNKWPLWFMRAVPFARAAAVTGSVAMLNARKKSDLDLLIISQKRRIWTTRIFALLVIELFSRRKAGAKEKICLNFFAAEGAQAPIQNIAAANMLARAIPLFGKKKYHEWLAQNRWTENFMYPPPKVIPEIERVSLAAKFFEYLLNGETGDWLEQFFKDWQYKRLTGKITSPRNLEHLVLTDEILMLHYPDPKNAKIMSAYEKYKNL